MHFATLKKNHFIIPSIYIYLYFIKYRNTGTITKLKTKEDNEF